MNRNFESEEESIKTIVGKVPTEAKQIDSIGTLKNEIHGQTLSNARYTERNLVENDFCFSGDVDDEFEEEKVDLLRSGALAQLDQYIIVKKIGNGSFGNVYKAFDKTSMLFYAIKTLHPQLKNNKEEIANLKREFKLVSSLTHTNIAKPLVLHQIDKCLYRNKEIRDEIRALHNDLIIVMELAPGETLFEWRRNFQNKIVPVNNAIEICRQIAEALDYAHSRKVIHRDIKPNNIMIEVCKDTSVVARVLDFGLAAEIRSSMSRVSRDNFEISGTLQYMSPEQWLGKDYNAATDQYALACVFYELVSGRYPFYDVFIKKDINLSANTVATKKPAKLKILTKKQNNILQKALSKDPKRRWSTCLEFVEHLKTQKTSKKKYRFLFIILIIVLSVFGIVKFYYDDVNGDTKQRVDTVKSNESTDTFHNEQENKSALAWYNDGIYYFNEKKYDDAKIAFEKAAMMGDPMSQNNLGFCYENGFGVAKPDLNEAIKWYKKAAENDNMHAKHNLAVLYFEGKGVKKNTKKAFELCLDAAEAGHLGAQTHLGICYQQGIGVKKDEKKAFEWIRKAAYNKESNETCYYNLGHCYYYGIGVIADFGEAVRWFKKAAELNHPIAQHTLGHCYRTGRGVVANSKKAFEFYKKAAENGYADSQYNLAMCYETGTGVKKDIQLAKKWYEKAAKNGVKKAVEQLKVLTE